jgi:oxygen-independent coproporphyrinogen-3 oxidase
MAMAFKLTEDVQPDGGLGRRNPASSPSLLTRRSGADSSNDPHPNSTILHFLGARPPGIVSCMPCRRARRLQEESMMPQPPQFREINDPPQTSAAKALGLRLASAEWLQDLLRQTDDWMTGQDLPRLVHQESARIDPRSWYWVDVYPRWRPAPPSTPEQMLTDWRAHDWRRIEFVYLHLPFCAQRCHFCYYFVSTDLSHAREYLEALRREVRAFLVSLPRDASAGDLFFGGGTPSMMAAADLQRLYDDVYEHLDRDRIGMVTLELHSRTMRREMHRLAASGHIRRVSMGVQTFSQPVLLANGRIWVEPGRIRKICADFREAGIEHIGLDFMVGLHTQTAADVLTDLRHIAGLAEDQMIDSVSVYPRSYTAIWGPFAGETIDDATLMEKFRCHLLYRRFFAGIGWSEGPMYLFSAPRFVPAVPSALAATVRTAQALAFGNSARSTFADTNYLNIRSPDEYREVMDGHAGATGAHQRMSRADVNRRYLHFSIKRGYFDEQLFPVPPTLDERVQLDEITDDLSHRGLVRRNGVRVELTEVGMILVELVHREYERTFPEPGR